MRQNTGQSQFLAGHKRVGKRFIPPLMQVPLAAHVSYIDNMLPELIWIGLLNDRLGYIDSSSVLQEVFLSIEEIRHSDQHGNFAIMSTFKSLSHQQSNSLIERLEERAVINVLRNSIAPLTLLYEGCPLSFIGPPDKRHSTDELILPIKTCVDRVADKYDTPGVILNGALLLSLLVTRRVSFSKEIEIPDFNLVVTAPESDGAKHAAAFMRANALAEFGMREIEPAWARYFWNRGIELSPCEFPENEVADE